MHDKLFLFSIFEWNLQIEVPLKCSVSYVDIYS